MGGDYAPQAIVEELIKPFSDIEVQLYGDESKIKQYLTATERWLSIRMKNKFWMMSLQELSARKKKNASMVLAAKAVKDGEADGSFLIQVPLQRDALHRWLYQK